jgi:2-oxoglutarate dehydrogenase complex dehydrogenase (E1) component-like enzyme
MKKSDLTKEQKEELEKFGANTWFVEYLYKQYKENPGKVPDQWKNFFGGVSSESEKKNGGTGDSLLKNINYPQPS